MPKKSTPQQIHIIGGHWKRTLLRVMDVPGLRPTPARVRETVFNWLDFLFHRNWQTKRCLDLFAGSGALGFEAASRGANHVTLVESHSLAVQQLEKIRSKLQAHQMQIIRGDAQFIGQKLMQQGEQFDVIFLDPPFHEEWLPKILPICAKLLREDGYLYLEAEQSFAKINDWDIVRHDRAGQVYFHLLQRENRQQIEA